jgi:hypothetical protein
MTDCHQQLIDKAIDTRQRNVWAGLRKRVVDTSGA